MLQFTGTGYLGLQHDRQWLAQVQVCLEKYGSNHPISRLNQHPDFSMLNQVEASLAQSHSAEAACLLSSGYLAGVAVSRYFCELAYRENLQMVYPANHHPCLTPPIGWSHREIAWDIKMHQDDGLASNTIVFAQTVDPYDGEQDPSLESVLFRSAQWRIIDCSHSMGLWDHRPFNDRPNQSVFVGSLGKACAFPAGFVAGPKDVIQAIKTSGEYCAAAPPSLAICAAYLQHETRRQQLRETLWRHQERMDRIWPCHRKPQNRFPIYRIGNPSQGLKSALEEAGVGLSWLRYPKPDSPLHLRAVVKANHQNQDVNRLMEFLTKHQLNFSTSPNKPEFWTIYTKP